MVNKKYITKKLLLKIKTKMLVDKFTSYVKAYADENKKISTTWLVKTVYKFCQLYSEIHFYPYQEQFAKRVIRSLIENDGEEISALFARQTGKQIY